MSKEDFPLSEDLQHLRNMIAEAKSDLSIRLLRKEIKNAAADESDANIIALTEALLQLRIDEERGHWIRRN